MTLSKQGERLQRTLQRAVNTTREIGWEAVHSDDFIFSKTGPRIKEGEVFVFVNEKSQREFTDMDYDLALNDPSRLQKIERALPDEIVRLHLRMDANGNVLNIEVQDRCVDKQKIAACIKHRHDGQGMKDCLYRQKLHDSIKGDLK